MKAYLDKDLEEVVKESAQRLQDVLHKNPRNIESVASALYSAAWKTWNDLEGFRPAGGWPTQTPDAIEQWEYRTEYMQIDEGEMQERSLNRLGGEGWELVHVHGGSFCVFKRPTNNREPV